MRADVDGDGDADATFIVNVEPGGSGSFQYLGAALSRDKEFRGLNFVFLGDRILPLSLRVRRGVIEVEYLNRGSGESMSTPPSVRRLGYTTLSGEELQALTVLEEGEQLLEALVTIGAEVRSVRPCDSDKEAWISGKSPALPVILSAPASGDQPYSPTLMVLAGRLSNVRDTSEFGSAYELTFHATHLVRSIPQSTC